MNAKKRTLIIASMIFTLGGSLSFNSLADTTPPRISEQSQHVDMIHRTVEIPVDYDRFIANLRKLLGHYDTNGAANVLSNPMLARKNYERMEGDQGLVLFDAMPHGNLLNLSRGTPGKAMLLKVGNALIASQLMAGDIRAGLYVPLSVFVWQVKPGLIRVEYDLPSSQLGQFDVNEVSTLAASLDAKLDRAMRDAAEASR